VRAEFFGGAGLREVEALVQVMSSVPGVYVLDREMDADHNRCVITLAAKPEAWAKPRSWARAKALELMT